MVVTGKGWSGLKMGSDNMEMGWERYFPSMAVKSAGLYEGRGVS